MPGAEHPPWTPRNSSSRRTYYHSVMKVSRLGALSIGLVVGSTLAGGFFGGKAIAGGGRLNEQLHLYTAMLGAIERDYMEEVGSD